MDFVVVFWEKLVFFSLMESVDGCMSITFAESESWFHSVNELDGPFADSRKRKKDEANFNLLQQVKFIFLSILYLLKTYFI